MNFNKFNKNYNMDKLDKINNERVETTKMRVVHAIKLLSKPVDSFKRGNILDNAISDLAHAVNLLEVAQEEMQFACNHFDWNDEICMHLDDACGKLGICLANLLEKDNKEFEIELASCDAEDAMNLLGKVLASLIRWFDDSQDKSEI